MIPIGANIHVAHACVILQVWAMSRRFFICALLKRCLKLSKKSELNLMSREGYLHPMEVFKTNGC